MSTSYPGIQEWDNPAGIHIFRLHYSADPERTEWARRQIAGMTDQNAARQEFEIDFSAKSGALMYPFQDEATIEPLSALPKEGTNYYFLDPHPRVPHAHLWIRVDKWGDAWAYREMWPSKVYGLPGNTPEDDNRFTIKQYVETIKWLETQEDKVKIQDRIIDYAARAFVADEEQQKTFQQKYEDVSRELGYPFIFRDCIKDTDAGVEAVLEWLKPRDVECADGTFRPKSKLHIIRERCPELIWQLHNNRFKNLTPILAEREDPSPKAIQKRNHLTDLLKYAALAKLQYIGPPAKRRGSFKPLHQGINY